MNPRVGGTFTTARRLAQPLSFVLISGKEKHYPQLSFPGGSGFSSSMSWSAQGNAGHRNMGIVRPQGEAETGEVMVRREGCDFEVTRVACQNLALPSTSFAAWETVNHSKASELASCKMTKMILSTLGRRCKDGHM